MKKQKIKTKKTKKTWTLKKNIEEKNAEKNLWAFGPYVVVPRYILTSKIEIQHFGQIFFCIFQIF